MCSATENHRTSKHPSGRRKGVSQTRDAILRAAVELFAEHGYDATTLRSITDQAGVDVAMVGHFFGSKQGLFDEAVVQQGQQLVQQLFDAQPERRPTAQLLDEYFSLWEDPATAQTVRAYFTAALESEEHRSQLQALMAERVSETLSTSSDWTSNISDDVISMEEDDRFKLYSQLVAAHLLGIGFSRYIMGLPPLSTMSRQALTAQLEPVFKAYRRHE